MDSENSIDERFDALDLVQNQLLESYRSLELKFNEQNKQINDLKKTNKLLEEKILNYSSIINLNVEKVETNNKSMEEIKKEFSDLTSAVGVVKTNFNEMKQSFDKLYSDNRMQINQEIQRIRNIIHKKIKNNK